MLSAEAVKRQTFAYSACLLTTCKNTDSQGCEALILPFTICGIAGTSQTARIRNHNQFIKNRKKRGKTIWK